MLTHQLSGKLQLLFVPPNPQKSHFIRIVCRIGSIRQIHQCDRLFVC